jgi:hypothetical protein
MKTRKRLTAGQQVKMCAEFNRKYPVGTRVKVYKVLDEETSAFEAVTRTEAQMMGGHTAVVWLEDVSGCYGLEFVKPLKAEAAAVR